MTRKHWARLEHALFLCISCLLLTACAGESIGGGGQPKYSNPEYMRTPPPLALPEVSGQPKYAKEDGRSGMIDVANLSKGYVAASCSAPAEVRFRVETGDYWYNYSMPNDGTVHYFPLARGNGSYTFTVYINLAGTEYEVFLQGTEAVILESEQAPFLVPNAIVNYGPDSEVVGFSYGLAEHASTDLEVVQQIYWWIKENITYDTEKARRVQGNTGYVPDVDSTLAEKKGICYDYAALAAAMFRANQIPCQLVMGDVETEDGAMVYHAWNLIWLDEIGEIAVKIPTTPGEWERLDLTFAAGGASPEFIGSGENYYDMQYH